jgi:hypothetical protein
MARTIEQITAAIRLEFPDPPGFPVRIAKQDTFLTGAEYEARLAERAQMIREQELTNDAQAIVDEERRQAVQLYQALKAGTATNRQIQSVLAFLLRREMT